MMENFSALFGGTEPPPSAAAAALGFGPGKAGGPVTGPPPVPAVAPGGEEAARKASAASGPFYLMRELPGSGSWGGGFRGVGSQSEFRSGCCVFAQCRSAWRVMSEACGPIAARRSLVGILCGNVVPATVEAGVLTEEMFQVTSADGQQLGPMRNLVASGRRVWHCQTGSPRNSLLKTRRLAVLLLESKGSLGCMGLPSKQGWDGWNVTQ